MGVSPKSCISTAAGLGGALQTAGGAVCGGWYGVIWDDLGSDLGERWGVAWRGVVWCGVAWRGVAWRCVDAGMVVCQRVIACDRGNKSQTNRSRASPES